MRTKKSREEVIHDIARRQHGVVTRAQLIGAGLTHDMVDRRLQTRQLRPLHRGVFLVGPLVAPRTNEMAAVLACGAPAAVCQHSAAVVWQLSDPTRDDKVHVAVPPERRCRHPGIRIHRIALCMDEATTLDQIPVTTPARTLYDLARGAARRQLERALAEALARELTSIGQLEGMCARHASRPGARRLRALLTCGEELARTRSEAERAFLDLITRAALPKPAVNTRVKGFEVDFYWRAERFVAEIDGYAFHGSRTAFEDDRRRDSILEAAGVRVVRVTWRQIMREPAALLVRLAQALALSSR